jgi:transcriptional regulator with XRE-family HTH domain
LEVVNKTSKYQKSIFVKNLISGRKKLGMSAEEFAEFADIKYPTLRDIEHGSSPGSARTKEKIAQALGTTVDNLNIPAVAPATSERADTILAALTLLFFRSSSASLAARPWPNRVTSSAQNSRDRANSSADSALKRAILSNGVPKVKSHNLGFVSV